MDYTLRGMRRRWRKPVKHADAFTEGVADLSAFLPRVGTVWIEAKALRRWPARATTKVVLGMSEAQRDFLWQREGWLFARIGREYLLFRGVTAREFVDRPTSTQAELRRVAKKIWRNKVNWKEFEECLNCKS